MIRIAILLMVSVAASAFPAQASSTISAECADKGKVSLSVSDERVSVNNSVSQFNLKSLIRLESGNISKPGYTAIFYGGQSRFFNSYDGTIQFRSTIGHGGSRRLSTAELQLESGVYSCIIK